MKTSQSLAQEPKSNQASSDEQLVAAFFEKAGMPIAKKRKVTFDAIVIRTKGWKFNRDAANER